MGASMMGPDYTQWHGNFEVAERMYTEFIPEVEELIEEARKNGLRNQANQVEDMLHEMLNSELHKWYIGKVDPEEAQKRKEAAAAFRQRYSNE